MAQETPNKKLIERKPIEEKKTILEIPTPTLDTSSLQPANDSGSSTAEKKRLLTPLEAKEAESQRIEQNGIVEIPEEGETRT
nr:hypothetical protein Iba_chr08aCG10130 [Ipomoea batatas]